MDTKTEIRKVNSLDELDNLPENSLVNVRNVLCSNKNYIYAGKNFNQEKREVVYSFLSFNKEYPQDRLIINWDVFESKIIFKNGYIDIASHNSHTYHPTEDGFNGKLKLIQEVIK